MNKYGLTFHPHPEHKGWFEADSDADAVVIHQNFDLGSDLVFNYSGFPHSRLMLVQNGKPAAVAKKLLLSPNRGDPEETCRTLNQLYKIARFTPTYLGFGGLSGRFIDKLNIEMGTKFWTCLNNNQLSHYCTQHIHFPPDYLGIREEIIWDKNIWERMDEIIVEQFVREQKFDLSFD